MSPRRRRVGAKHLGLGAVGIAVIVATFAFVLPRVANYRDVWAVVETLSWRWVAALAVAVALNVATFAPPWQVALPGLRFLPALKMTQASTALSIIAPGGVAVGMAGQRLL